MSKVTITLELDRYICTELEDIREMIRDYDFSGLKASVERIQKHANAMEKALYNYKDYLEDIRYVLKGEEDTSSVNSFAKKSQKIPLNDKEKLEAIEVILKKKYKDNW